MKVLILGGYGTFGGRLAELLRDESRLELIIAGRSLSSAEAFVVKLGGQVKAMPQVFDRDGDVALQLATIKPDMVVDASGPFQTYGGKPYRVVEAAIAQGIHYLDLADGSDFVEGIARFSERAKAKNVFVLAGVSSFPVLTAAVVAELSKEMSRIDHVRAGIAPSPYAGVGLNVIRAIASYSGKPVEIQRDGKLQCAYALTETMRYTVAAPGKLPLHNIHYSLVDVPDLKVLPAIWPQLRSVWMGAGPVPAILHRSLNWLAWLVRWKILPSAYPFAPIMNRVINTISWGEHRGGMFVEVEGLDRNEKPIKRAWHLIAEAEDGPMIPSMAAEAIVRACLAGNHPAFGARAAAGELTLADYEKLFSRREIFAGVRNEGDSERDKLVFPRLLGEAFDRLPPTLREMHGARGKFAASGTAMVERGRSPLAALVCAVMGFPEAGEDVPVRVDFTASPEAEAWRRTFAGRVFHSRLRAGEGKFKWLLHENFGSIGAGIALVVDGERLRWVTRRWSIFGIPLPLALAPHGDSYEFEENGRFNFHVEIRQPLIGLIVRYRGWLTPEAPGEK
jgi:hypothetical protein